MCCHFKLFRLDFDASDYSRESALAWIILRSNHLIQRNWIDDLDKIKVSDVSEECMRKFISEADRNVKNSEYITQSPALPISEKDLEKVLNPKRLKT